MNKLICLESVDSTNAYLMRNTELPHGTAVLANAQTAGRGRLGRDFFSAAGQGVYLSVLLHPDCAPEKAPSFTPNLAVAVSRAMSHVCGVTPEIKWVNDLLIGGKKVCGILCESVIENGSVRSIVAGIGVNVSAKTEDFPEPLREIAGSIFSQTGKSVERGRLALEIINELEKMFELWFNDDEAYLEDYRRLCCVVGKPIRIISSDGEETAFAESVSNDFGLVVVNEHGRKVLHGGEISVRI